jgi:UTP--glucose-1-phosphate uridylyltransferase
VTRSCRATASSPRPPTPTTPDVYRVTDLVEKPGKANAPSNLCIIGRYVLTPDIFDHIAGPGRGGAGRSS